MEENKKDPFLLEFKNEIYEKKKLTYGNRAKTSASGRRASFRGVKTQYDYMSTKERKQLNSEVKTSHLDDIIIKKHDFDLLPEERQKHLLIHWRNLHSNKAIMEGMELKGNAAFHNLITKLDIPLKKKGYKRGPKGTRNKEAEETRREAAVLISKKAPQEEAPTIQQTEQPIKILQNGLHLEYNGLYTAEQLSKIFTKLQLITDGEECKFYLNISLSEREE